MLADRKKLCLIVCLCLSTLFATLACVLAYPVSGNNSQLPVKSLTLTISKNQREELFDQLQKFADDHGFRLTLTKYEKIEHFMVTLSRNDILVTATDVPPDPALVYISFYAAYPGAPVDEEVIDELATELKSSLGEIPDVTITEEE